MGVQEGMRPKGSVTRAHLETRLKEGGSHVREVWQGGPYGREELSRRFDLFKPERKGEFREKISWGAGGHLKKGSQGLDSN